MSENQRYCAIHGCPLVADRYCEKCHRQHGDYEKRINESKPLSEDKYLKDWSKRTYLASRYLCHNCKIIQWHPLIHCPMCGGKFVNTTITNSELTEKYGHYKTGY